ncbi:GntR family transcriptional regulator [Streptomyces europaeiscabiei]|uniref:GntR family transcriptional regulator n=1 Tax=Streptomyces europaeiscabiei TaxID=146819 RepID=A0ABU4NKN0_9ACTN|nr:GntR family transcriptional regulator [Streptomyces europaeiscabiei]MDX3546307.1 GntR family transcriptional regulator [Streptomyces europaeiscabiei]MDX3558464.1 GntR family transcriptional regulator [Streptomyces europaeiscabiei]MDX3703705.1 GntR family transcriptional regulator [Streptomyces europaeiscabiei]MDX3708881.1 GntR family transcriptional regulator [Streptomyces europaeiscabiei]MDX3830927.1 GntR family transcriptional regulator [Streptomyces europaeiscabiei]
MPGTGGGNGAVTRSTLRQQLADALRDEVLAGRLKPGQEFTVKEIAEQYGVSATPVREALVDLSAQGLLDAVQHRGFEVHAYSVADYRNMVEARILVTDGMFRRLGDRKVDPRTAAALAGVRRRGEEARRAATAGDLDILIGYDLRFWRELSALFGNPYLTDFLHRLRVQAWVCAVQHLRQTDVRTDSRTNDRASDRTADRTADRMNDRIHDGANDHPDDLKGRLWADHTDLVDALTRRDAQTAQELIAGYDEQSLTLVERLADG